MFEVFVAARGGVVVRVFEGPRVSEDVEGVEEGVDGGGVDGGCHVDGEWRRRGRRGTCVGWRGDAMLGGLEPPSRAT